MTDTKSAAERILIVEDDGLIAMHLQSMLARLGYDVAGAVASGEEALQKVDAEAPALALMDIHLAGELNGVETAAQLRARCDVPVIYLTAYSEDSLLEQAKLTEPYGYLVKPVQERELRATVETALYRHKLEAELRASEARFRSIFEHSNDAIFVIDPERDEIIDANAKACDMLGYSHEELLSLSASDIHPHQIPRFMAFAQSVLEQGHGWTDALTCLTKSGQSLASEMSAAVVDIAGRRCLISAIRDVTERRQMEARLRTLSMAVEQNPSSIVITDAEGCIEYVNPQFTETTGYTPEEVVGKDMGFMNSGLHPPEFFEQLWATIKSGRVFQADICNKKKNGELYWELQSISSIKDATGAITHFVAARIDDTERKRAQAALERSEELYRSLIESAPDAIIVVDEAGHIQRANAQAEACFGYTREELLGRSIETLVPGRFRGTHAEHRAAYHADPRIRPIGTIEMDLYARRKDGSEFPTEISLSPLQTENGVLVTSIVRDVTARVQAEAALRRQLAELSALHAIAVLGAEAKDENALVERATQIIGETFFPDNFGMMILDEAAGVLRLHPSYRIYGKVEEIATIPLERGVTGQAAADGQPRRVPDVTREPAYIKADARMRSELCVPLKVGARVIGVINAESAELDAFSEDDERLLSTLAGQLATAIEKVRLFAELEQRVAEQAALLNLSQLLLGETDAQTILEQAVRIAAETLRAELAAIAIVDADGQSYSGRAAIGWPPETLEQTQRIPLAASTGLGYAIRTQAPVVVPDEARETRFGTPPFVTQMGITASLIAPMLSAEEAIGGLVVNSRAARNWNEDEVRLLSLIANTTAQALERARLFERVLAGRERLEGLSRQLVQVQEDERRYIARELHDEVGQLLTGLKFTLETSMQLPAAAARDKLERADALVGQLIAQVRELSLDLRPAILDDLGLLPALLWLLERIEAQVGISINFEHAELEERFAPEVETAAYRIVQEALTNVARHAGVNEASVHVWCSPNALCLRIEDDGVGFDPEAALAATTTSGLSGMRERAVLLGGQLEVETANGAGTRLTAELPLGGWVERRLQERSA